MGRCLVSHKSALLPDGVAVKLRALPTLEKEYDQYEKNDPINGITIQAHLTKGFAVFVVAYGTSHPLRKGLEF